MPRAAAKRAARRDGDPSIIEVMEDPYLFGRFFDPPDTWEPWKVALSAAFALPPPRCKTLDPLEFFRQHTGRTNWPTSPAREIWNVIGARGGKSRVAALISSYLGVFCDYSPYLAQGEYGTLPLIAADRKQARNVFSYLRAFLSDTPLLAPLVVGETADSLTLAIDRFARPYGVRLEVHTASFRSLRGYTCIGCVGDEIAVWQSEGSANPDTEIVTAIRSRFATIPTAVFVAISSPYARSGELYKTYDRHFGDKGSLDMFVWKAATREMNPSVSQAFIDREYERDPARASAEFGGEFRTDVERFVPLEVVKACVPVAGRESIPPAPGVTYGAFVDPSGGRADPMTCAIAHRARLANGTGPIVIDALYGKKPPFEPTAAVNEIAALCRQYRITKVHGDRFGGEWPREAFRNQGLDYELHPKSKSELYVEMLPHLTSRTIELLDHPKLTQEIVALERRVSPSGRELIDHPKGGHDDHANAVAGVVALLAGGTGLSVVWGSGRVAAGR